MPDNPWKTLFTIGSSIGFFLLFATDFVAKSFSPHFYVNDVTSGHVIRYSIGGNRVFFLTQAEFNKVMFFHWGGVTFIGLAVLAAAIGVILKKRKKPARPEN